MTVAWSYSYLQAFETCPKRFYHTKIAKDVIEPQTEALTHGNEVHKALELAVAENRPLPEKYKTYIPIVEAVKASPGIKKAEMKFGLTKSFAPTTFFAKDVWVRGVLDFTAINGKSATVLDWKGLALDTVLPTPSGWTTMGEVQVGDRLFGADGKPCTVVGKSQVHARPCFRVTFDDTTSVVCDDQHLWEVNGEVVDTLTLRATLTKHGQKWRTVKIAAPLDAPDADLPLHPYVLGAWLADGKHTSGEVCKPDQEIWDRIVACGYSLGQDTSSNGRATARTVLGIRGTLRRLGVLGNKHIPPVYLRASYSQRLDLLRGLMDGDGNANPTRKQAVFTTVSKTLSDQVMELLCSLGQRPLQSTVQAHGFGKSVNAYPISFRPINMQPFYLPRKAERVLHQQWGPGNSSRRLVLSVEPVESVPTQCVAVDSPDSTYLCTRRMVVTHNTGKPKTDGDQMKLFAGATFALYPSVEKVKTGYVWLGHDRVDSETYTRADIPAIWNEFIPRVERVEYAIKNSVFNPNPSGLCRAWCPVPRSKCEFSGKA